MNSKNTTKMGNQKKILVMGLDNSGKSSLILSRSGVKNLLSYCSLKPTPKIRINEICLDVQTNQTTYIWDFGGQTDYREGYLEKLEHYAQGANFLMYVVDVQDVARYEVSINFLKNIIEKLADKQISLKIELYLHKFDPYLKTNEDFDMKQIKNKLIPGLKAIIPEQYSYRVYRSSIYTVYQQTLVEQNLQEEE